MVGGVVIQARGGRIRQTAKPKPVIDIRAPKYEDQMGALPVCTPTSYPELYDADVLIVARFHDCRVQSRVAHRGQEDETDGLSRPRQSSVCRTSTRLVLLGPRMSIICLLNCGQGLSAIFSRLIDAGGIASASPTKRLACLDGRRRRPAALRIEHWTATRHSAASTASTSTRATDKSAHVRMQTHAAASARSMTSQRAPPLSTYIHTYLLVVIHVRGRLTIHYLMSRRTRHTGLCT